MKTINSFETLINTQLPYLEEVAYHYVHDNQDAKDLLQDTIVRIWSNRDKFVLGTNFKAWASVIMRNIFINAHRKQQSRKTYSTDLDENKVEDHFENTGEQKMAYDDLLREVRTLKTIYSQPLELYYIGYSYQEIAEDQGISLGTVKSRLHMARGYLKERLALAG